MEDESFRKERENIKRVNSGEDTDELGQKQVMWRFSKRVSPLISKKGSLVSQISPPLKLSSSNWIHLGSRTLGTD